MLTDYPLTAIILSIIVLFCVNVVASCYSLGRMHTWLKERGEVFGDNAGLRDELADIRGHIIGQANDEILD